MALKGSICWEDLRWKFSLVEGGVGGPGGDWLWYAMRDANSWPEGPLGEWRFPLGGARTGAGVFYSARVSSVAQRLETRPCWSNN